MPNNLAWRIGCLLVPTLLACDVAAQGRMDPGGEEFGAGITLERISPLRDVVAHPEAYGERPVLVHGQVRDVCQRRGCWMILSDGEAHIRVRFRDYAFFVPRDAAGREAYVEGRVKREVMSEEDARHQAEESSRVDPETIQGPQTVVSLIASGVRLVAPNRSP